jgi:hypothetical protein
MNFLKTSRQVLSTLIVIAILGVLAYLVINYQFYRPSNNPKEDFTQGVSIVNILDKPILPSGNLSPKNPKDFSLQEIQQSYNLRFNNFLAQKIYSHNVNKITLTIINEDQNQQPEQKKYWNSLNQFLAGSGSIEESSGQNIIQKIFLPTIPDSQKNYWQSVDTKNINWAVDNLQGFLSLDGTNLDGEPTVNLVGKRGFEYFLIEAKVELGSGVLDSIRDECGVQSGDYSNFSLECYKTSLNNSPILEQSTNTTTQSVINNSEVI